MIINYWWQLSLLIIVSYFVGNFCGAVFISKNYIQRDIRGLGSKNAGTTNMTRVFGLKYGAATLIIDFLKGLICVLAAKAVFNAIGAPETVTIAAFTAGLGVLLGHNYPVMLGFKGGKGFATGLGIFIAINPLFTVILIPIGIVLLFIIDRMSILALTFFMLEEIFYLVTCNSDNWWILIFTSAYLILAIIGHRTNIRRLIRGEEKPLGTINFLRNKKLRKDNL